LDVAAVYALDGEQYPMDRFLIDYLRSRRAWVLVGSGPSAEMGYPSWGKLAEVAIATVKADHSGHLTGSLDAANHRGDFPGVFEEAQRIVGAPRLLQALHAELKPSRSAEIYKLISRWPVPVYLTTNYDDELHMQLGSLGETYLPYTNSEAHMAHLLPDLQGAIFKLHGDLRSETGLILTRSHYKAIQSDASWQYWRTKMTSVFQMTPVVVIGHSLSDPNFQHVLQAAKHGAGVLSPVCWVAPDIDVDNAREYLEKFRIRVISYNNRDGDHANLLRLLEQITDFIPARTSVHISDYGRRIIEHTGSAAPAFFVFNRLAGLTEYQEKRTEILIAAIESAAPTLAGLPNFTVKMALERAGWPSEVPLPSDVEADVGSAAVERGLLAKQGDAYVLAKGGLEVSGDNRRAFQHTRDRFSGAVVRRIRADFPRVNAERADELARDIEGALTGYFREGGLTLASLLFSADSASECLVVPPSVLRFMNDASAKYGDMLDRQVFITTSLRIFTRAGSAERDYLGRLAQGFFGFHALGAFGDVAIERLRQGSATVWLLDSNVQIAMLAIGGVTSDVWQECVRRLVLSRIRFFTLDRLFDETREHWWFADRIVKEHGPASRMVVAAALGETPFRRSNLFLEGFVRWQAAGHPADWEGYMFQVFGTRSPTVEDIRRQLVKKGIEVLPFSDWPGFNDQDYVVRDEYAQEITRLRRPRDRTPASPDEEQLRYPHKKAIPEAESLIVIQKERRGDYHMLSVKGVGSPAWFVSDTSILNAIEKGLRVTWQPEAFLRFASTLSTAEGGAAAERAFDTLLWGLAQTGLSLLDEKTAEKVLGGVIDQANITIEEMRQMYEATLAEKYGEPLDSVLAKLDPIDRPLAALQLANEISQAEALRRTRAEALAEKERRRAVTAEIKLKEVDRFRAKMEAKKERGRKKARKQKAMAQRKRK
jgi:hypothetical protein